MVGASFAVAAAAEVIRTKKGIRAVGNAQIDTAQSKFGGAAALFDGNGDYLLLENQSSFAFTGDFTIEFWWYQPSNVAAGIYPTFIAMGALSSDGGWQVSSEPTTNKVSFITSPNGSSGMAVLATTNSITAASWHHIAVVRSSSVVKIYVDGTQSGSTYTTTGNPKATTGNVYIGGGLGGLSSGTFSSTSATVVNLNGSLDEIRVSDSARYTATFTPSTSPFVNDANTLLLIHANGTDASTYFEDDNGIRAPNTPISVNGAMTDEAQKKFGFTSLRLDGTNDYIELPYSSSLATWNASGGYTVEYWIRVASLTGLSYADGASTEIPTAFGNHNPTDNVNYWSFGPISNGSVVFFYYNGSKICVQTAGVTLAINTWYHLAMVYNGSTIKIYVDGTERASASVSGTPQFGSGTKISHGAAGSTTNYINGWTDEMRVSSIARYTAGFTPSTSEFVNDANTLLLYHFNGIDDGLVLLDDNGQRACRSVRTVGNVENSSVTKIGITSAFYGTDKYNEIAPISWHNASTGTIEFYFRFNGIAASAQALFSQCTQSSANGFQLLTVSNQLYWYRSGSTGALVSSTTFTTGVWYHVAVVKESSTTVKIYLDGTLAYTNTSNSGLTESAGNFWLAQGFGISSGTFDSTRYSLDGYLDEFRISTTARYTANFTPPTTPLQSDSNTVLLMHFDGTTGQQHFFDDNGKDTTPFA